MELAFYCLEGDNACWHSLQRDLDCDLQQLPVRCYLWSSSTSCLCKKKLYCPVTVLPSQAEDAIRSSREHLCVIGLWSNSSVQQQLQLQLKMMKRKHPRHTYCIARFAFAAPKDLARQFYRKHYTAFRIL